MKNVYSKFINCVWMFSSSKDCTCVLEWGLLSRSANMQVRESISASIAEMCLSDPRFWTIKLKASASKAACRNTYDQNSIKVYTWLKWVLCKSSFIKPFIYWCKHCGVIRALLWSWYHNQQNILNQKWIWDKTILWPPCVRKGRWSSNLSESIHTWGEWDEVSQTKIWFS